jgi:asparagine synthase (glutamine-hydrolysing)
MCGITGWFSSQPIEHFCKADLFRMMQTIDHRGPDGKGALLSEHAAFGHTRLAVIDLEKGEQPLSLENRFHIIFNGEIYNYRELRADLIKRGYRFKTQSDTEVILVLYAHYGRHAFSLLRGMFAIAIWDSEQQCGVLARDEIGIKPLFYSKQTNGDLVFGSEAKAILAKSQTAKGVLDTNALHLVMNFRYLPGSLSLFQGIQQLKPGTILQWQVDGSVKKYNFHFQEGNSDGSILDVFEESVRLHLTSDVEVGAYLSGGVDSASITALAAKCSSKQLRTFTMNIGDDPNEAVNAEKTAILLGVDNIQGDVNINVAKQLPWLMWHLEVPKVNAFQVSHLSQLASTHVKVVLSGLGGDELFLGYNAHRIMSSAHRVSKYVPDVLSRSLSASAVASSRLFQTSFWSEKERAVLMFGALGNWSRVYGLLRNVWDNPDMRQAVYGPRMLDADLANAFTTVSDDWPDNADPVLAMAEFEWRNKMVNDLLWQEDRCSMAHGLEVRVPFLDPALAASVKSMSKDQLMPNGRPKGYMREMLQQLLPAEVMNRPKSGFQVDAASFFQTQLSVLADYWLSPDMVRDKGLFNPEFVATVRAYPASKKVRWHYFMLYLMLMSHLWVELFEQGNTPVQLADAA